MSHSRSQSVLPRSRVPTLARVLALALSLSACATHPSLEEGRRMASAGRHEEAAARLSEALAADIGNVKLRSEVLRQQSLAVDRLTQTFVELVQAGRFDEAAQLVPRVRATDPASPRAAELDSRLAQARRHAGVMTEASKVAGTDAIRPWEARLRDVLAADPSLTPARRLLAEAVQRREAADAQDVLPEPMRRPVTIEFRDAPLRAVFEALSRTSAVNFVFDRDVRADTRVNVMLRDVGLDEAVRTILQTQGLDARRLNDSTYLVFPNTTPKAREYVPMQVRTFYLSNADAKQAQSMVRAVVKSKDVHVDEKLNALVVKDTPDALVLAARLLQQIDLPEAEVMLEIEVLEVARTRLTELGLKFPNQVSFGLLPLTSATGTAITQTVTRDTWTQQATQITSPSLVANLRGVDSDTNLLSNPRIRVRNREKAKFQIGEKVPVFATSFAGTGVGIGTALGATTTYIDVGLKVEVEPLVHQEGDVDMKVALEVSSILEQVTGPAQTTAYRIGTRQAQTALRLRDGETQVLGGLIRDEDSLNASRVPGLGDLPILGKLFSSELRQRNKTEIIMMITPRIVRAVEAPPDAMRPVMAGTDAAAGVAPLRLSASARAAVGGNGMQAALPPPPAGTLPPTARPRMPGAPPLDDGSSTSPVAAEVPATLALRIEAPTRVQPGQDFTVTVQGEGGELQSGAKVDLVYDPGAFGIPGPVTGGSGRAELLLQGSPPTARLALRASPAGSGAGSLSVAGAQGRNSAGQPVTFTLPQSFVITIQP